MKDTKIDVIQMYGILLLPNNIFNKLSLQYIHVICPNNDFLMRDTRQS